MRSPYPNTSNMLKHLSHVHMTEYAEYKRRRFQKLREFKFGNRPLTGLFRSEVWRHFQLNRDKTRGAIQ